jgi:hypothetical protein
LYLQKRELEDPMKFAIFLNLILAQNAFACYPQEAQFGGTVKSVQINQKSCRFELDLNRNRFWASSGVCPLDIPDVTGQLIEIKNQTDHSCRVQPGQFIDGYLSSDQNGVLTYEP